jgi:hypothetical protein
VEYTFFDSKNFSRISTGNWDTKGWVEHSVLLFRSLFIRDLWRSSWTNMTASLLPCQNCSNSTQYIKKGPSETQITVQMSEAAEAFKKFERTFFRHNIRFFKKSIVFIIISHQANTNIYQS